MRGPRHLSSLLWSLIAMVGAAVLPVVTLGLSSYLVYLAASPVLRLFYPPIWAAKGPLLWPVLIGAGILWSASFLVAGILDTVLKARGHSATPRRIACPGVLWIGSVAALGLMLHLSAPPDGFRA
ncbi:MAG: hypothetical protein B7Y84_07990 [Azorhizobium sp. 32-67-21]|nr:MAG: hypothetical protein B7Y84_07990 [Azorhizobium sp. 32-67-21]